MKDDTLQKANKLKAQIDSYNKLIHKNYNSHIYLEIRLDSMNIGKYINTEEIVSIIDKELKNKLKIYEKEFEKL